MGRRPQAAPGGQPEAPNKHYEALRKPQGELNGPRRDPLGSPTRPSQTPREIMFPESLLGTWFSPDTPRNHVPRKPSGNMEHWEHIFINFHTDFKYSGGALLVGDVAGVVVGGALLVLIAVVVPPPPPPPT